MNIFSMIFVAPVVNALLVFYKAFEYLHIPSALGLSIIAITVVLRLAINPLMHKQLLHAKKMQEIQPHITKLQKKHKGNAQKLQQAQMELFKKHNLNPAFGCVVLLVQIPVFYGLYMALQTIVVAGGVQHAYKTINALVYAPWLTVTGLDTSFFGLRLEIHPNEWSTVGWWYLLIPVITATLQFYQSYLSTKVTPMGKATVVVKESDKENKLAKGQSSSGRKDNGSDMQAAMQKQMLYLFPAMIAFASYSLPIGLALYWNIFTLFGIWQYRAIASQT
ncbi:hypothetical protein COU89_03630 [Candidatus Roizmanbacteria bacterium CG10_big_fil_rev_8_21_14_0_10_45_7]|uniref:Membrane insertase YidC/Oxa/ALB C-terminal domain-containing protein n=1 Tax=Candidatus Roizmanbacteria bacterium CG10_big_fil_rev_8_21_14_0_10_45_7 TaxID=1974854 RepID=A0A2M8KTX5_9BACT|nr:MAG: hypothetical protein COU89_03630 [Candidatus Roizmanbacteria bacterium CG10_big_fil_rev_8_21_14_0_10_45_7]